jgi:hypothetical protein
MTLFLCQGSGLYPQPPLPTIIKKIICFLLHSMVENAAML